MAKTEIKTKENNADINEFISKVEESQRADCRTILKMMEEVSGEQPKMWGATIVGFGNEHLKYESGREVDWFKIGFSPRKQNLTLYGLKFYDAPPLLKELGKFTEGKGCIYIKRLEDINIDVLRQLMKDAVK